MASVSGKQHRFMELVAHNPGAAKRLGVSQKVGEDFAKADQKAGKHFKIPRSHPKMHTSKHN
jgi:hypothetical protein